MLEYLPWKKRAKEPTAVSAVLTQNEPVERPTTATTTTATPESPKPVLSRHDEEFLKKTLEDADDQPTVILQGSGSTTPSISPSVAPLATPQSGTPAAANNSGDAEVKGKSKKEKEKDEKAAEWKEGIRNRWEGLRRSASSAVDKSKKEKEEEKAAEWKEGIRNRWEGLRRSASSVVDKRKGEGKGKVEEGDVKENGKGKEREKEGLEVKEEEKSEEDELRRALDGLNLAAEGGRAFSISPETAQLIDRFTQILKDLANGVPTAYNDLVELLESSSKTLEETFNSLPGFLQNMIKTLPKKIQTNMTPEALRMAAAVTPAAAAEAETLSSVPGLRELVTKPGLLIGMLKGVVNLLKTRFPMALGGANLAISMGLFVVLFVLWYCYKRGREERLESERLAAEALANGEGSATGAATGAALTVVERGEGEVEKEE